MSSNSPFGRQAGTQVGSTGSSSFDFQKRLGRSPAGLVPATSSVTSSPTSSAIASPSGYQAAGGVSGSAQGPTAFSVGASQAPTRLDDLIALLSSIDMAAQPDPAAPNTLIIPLQGEPRFRIVAPPDSHFMMLVADVFTGNEQEISQMAPSLLHANYTCQRLALEAQLPGVGADILPEEAKTQWLPVMGLDLERMTVVLSLQIPYRRVDDEDFGDFMSGLVETIANDAEVLVQQFKAITASIA